MASPVRSTTGDVELTFDATLDASGTIVTQAFDAGSDANRHLLAIITYDGASSHTLGDTSCAYNGVTMSPLGASFGSGQSRTRVFQLINPTSGSNDFTLDPSAGVGSEDVVITLMCKSNVDQTTAYENYVTATGTDSSNPYTSAVTITSSATDRLVVTGHAVRASSVTGGTATNFTERTDNVNANIGLVTGEAAGASSVATSVAWAGVFAIDYGAFGISLVGISPGPTITSEPSSAAVVLNNDTRTSATFVATAVGTGDIIGQWQKEGVNISNGGIYSITESPAGTFTCIVTPTDATFDGQTITCELTDDTGTRETVGAILTILNGPEVNPTSGSTTAGVHSTDLTSDDELLDAGECLLISGRIAASVVARTITNPMYPSVTPSLTATPSVTPSITPSVTRTPSITPSLTATPTVTPTRDASPTQTPSVTPSITPTITRTPSLTPSITPSRSPSRTPTPTPTPSTSRP